MNMVGHNNKYIHGYIRKPVVCAQPSLFDDFSQTVQLHFLGDNFPKYFFVLPGAQGDKIGAVLGIIIIHQPGQMAMMDGGMHG